MEWDFSSRGKASEWGDADGSVAGTDERGGGGACETDGNASFPAGVQGHWRAFRQRYLEELRARFR